jgi:oligopeptide transport system substrate-binding protein
MKNEYHVYPAPGGFWMTYNNKKAPFDNPKVRLAFAKAINRDELAAKVSHGQYKPLSVFIPENVAGYDPSKGSIQKYDPTEAKKELDASGAPAALLQDLHILIRDTTTNKLLGQYIQAQLQDHLGVKITLDVIDSKTVTKKIRKGDFQIYGPDGWGMDYPNPQDIMDIEITAGCHGVQFECYSNKTYDDLVTKGDSAKDLSAALKDYSSAEQLILSDAAVGIIYNRPDWLLVKPYVQGITANAYDVGGLYFPGDLYSQTIYISQH